MMTDQNPRAICIGEVVIELARGTDGTFALSCGGDVFNTAIYLARAGIGVAFATALGDDPYSDSAVALAAAEGVSSNLMLRVPGRLPALRLIETAAAGACTAHRWDEAAPVRELFELSDWMRIAESLTAGAADLFLRHHAVALFKQRAWPAVRRAGSGAATG